ncbi:MAG: 4Fe-4S binding protein [Proteobacteria bacterium]|nr:4Fe-4S binding protein [Pseudomonadota bacterium]MBU1581551.1 4Fe-4S binding protein [Pseudomonadota bacterium]MBU2454840.1 4Fe-4S binding protein [Pseudomonadota bacterium]MBU2627346.1 4Fe-4S binding protein [Pseudomonadota bacterium]
MNKETGVLYFSPTNTTKKICKAIALGRGSKAPQILDITLPKARAELMANPKAMMAAIDHLVVGIPVHSGKLPIQVLECLNAVEGYKKECTAIVAYGNRGYGIALSSLVEILSKNGFKVAAAGAFIGQHSYSDIIPIAMGRPDKSDIAKAIKLGENSLDVDSWLSLRDIPDQIDTISSSEKYTALKPYFNVKKCVKCGQCAENCPVGVLSPDTGTYLSRAAKKQCIGCMACVGSCKKTAKSARVNLIVKLVMQNMLKQASRERKEPLMIVSEK